MHSFTFLVRLTCKSCPSLASRLHLHHLSALGEWPGGEATLAPSFFFLWVGRSSVDDQFLAHAGHVTRDITERDRKQKFRPNQNVLCDVTSRWSMRITAQSSDS